MMDILAALEKARVAHLGEKHFVYGNDRHGPLYVNIDELPKHESLAHRVYYELGFDLEGSVDVVVGIGENGLPLAEMTARHMAVPPATLQMDVCSPLPDPHLGIARALRRKEVLIVKEVLDSCDAISAVIAMVRDCGGVVIGVSVIYNQTGASARSLGVEALHEVIPIETFEAPMCLLCAQQVPIVKGIDRGSRFAQKHRDYSGGFIQLSA